MSQKDHNSLDLLLLLEEETERHIQAYMDSIRYIKRNGRSPSMELLAKNSMKFIEKALNFLAEEEFEREKEKHKKALIQ